MNNYYNCTFNVHNFYASEGSNISQKNGENEMPNELVTEDAQKIWIRLLQQGWVNEQLQPEQKLTDEQCALLAGEMADKLNLNPRFKLFENGWHMKNLRVRYAEGINRASNKEFYSKVHAIIYQN